MSNKKTYHKSLIWRLTSIINSQITSKILIERQILILVEHSNTQNFLFLILVEDKKKIIDSQDLDLDQGLG